MAKLNHNLLFDTRNNEGCPKDCEFRKPGCQSYCRVYKLSQKKRQEEKEQIIKERNKYRILDTKPAPVRKR